MSIPSRWNDPSTDPHDQPHQIVEVADAGLGRRLVLEQTVDGTHLRYRLVFDTGITSCLACFDCDPDVELDDAGVPPAEVLWIAQAVATGLGSGRSAN